MAKTRNIRRKIKNGATGFSNRKHQQSLAARSSSGPRVHPMSAALARLNAAAARQMGEAI